MNESTKSIIEIKIIENLNGEENSVISLGAVLQQGNNNFGFPAGTPMIVQHMKNGLNQVTAHPNNIIKLPGNLPAEKIQMLLQLTFSLWAWDLLKLEIGECALVAGHHPFFNTLCQSALWRGALPVICLTDDKLEDKRFDIIYINPSDSETTTELLANITKAKYGFAAINVSGQPGIIDIILNSMPKWGRLLFAGHSTQPLTIDYYNNVHRSGALLYSTNMNPINIVDWINRNKCDEYIEQSYRILANKEMTAQLI